MADVTKIDVVSMLEPDGEPEIHEDLKRISKLFYGTKNGDLIEALDADVVASIKTVLDAYGIVPVMVNQLAGGSGGASVVYVDYEPNADFTEFTTETDFEDIVAAYEAGSIIKARIDGSAIIGAVLIFDLVKVASTSVVFSSLGIASGGEKIECNQITHASNGTITLANYEAS